MKHSSFASFVITIIIAVICGAWVSRNNVVETKTQMLLSSSSTIDQLAGIEKVTNESFDSLVTRLTPLLGNDPKVSIAASKALVLASFRDSCVNKLSTLQLDSSWYDASQWWATHKDNVTNNLDRSAIACDIEAMPWLRRLAALHSEVLDSTCIDMLTTMPLLDRDGSILLATLSIYKHLDAETTQSLIASWNTSIDIDRRKVALLLQGLLTDNVEKSDSDPQVQNISNIIQKQSANLAWRTMHHSDGSIDPDIFLAGMIVDRNRFMSLLVETVNENRWTYPEHATELARTFAPDIVHVLPETLQIEYETREEWWDLLACGLLLEQR